MAVAITIDANFDDNSMIQWMAQEEIQSYGPGSGRNQLDMA